MPTVRVNNPDGSSTVTTTNADGKEIRKLKFNAEGELTERQETNPKTGRTETSTYKDGALDATDRFGEFGQWLGGERYDDQGRVLVRSKPLPGGGEQSEDYGRDDKGQITRITISRNGSITEVVYLEYDEAGRIVGVSRDVVDNDSSYEPEYTRGEELAKVDPSADQFLALVTGLLSYRAPTVETDACNEQMEIAASQTREQGEL
ncbi:MAG: hypothetical protein AAGI88_23640 [Pseudomonadota bacterium]